MPKQNWPTQAEAQSFYGNPMNRDGTLNQSWYAANVVKIAAPYPVYFGAQQAKLLAIHKKCADSAKRVLASTWDKCGRDLKKIKAFHIDRYSGSFNLRAIRGSTRLSMHSYACAWDWDAAENGLGDRTPFFGFDHPLVVAHLEEGWIWGADWDGDFQISDENRPDGMHFQACRVR